MKKLFDWREFSILFVAGTLAVVAIIPYSLTLQGPGVMDQLAAAGVPLAVTLAISVAQNAVLVAVAVGIGLLLAGKVGLGAPLIEGWLAREPVGERLRRMLLPAVLLGVTVGVVIVLLDLLFASAIPVTVASSALNPPAWQGFLASFYGGITEELLMRLFLMSLLAWFLGMIWHDGNDRPRVGAFWAANLGAAILFGVGHLPALSLLVAPTPLLIFRTILLNSIGGIVFGYLYWKRGLESAMLAHFSADIVLHVLLPLLFG